MPETEFTHEEWRDCALVRRLRADDPQEPEELLDELADGETVERLHWLGWRDLARLQNILLDERWTQDPDPPATAEQRAAGLEALARYWRGGPLLQELAIGDTVLEVELALDDVRLADPEAAPSVVWELLQWVEPRLEMAAPANAWRTLEMRLPAPSPGERAERARAAAQADERFDAAEDSAQSQLFSPRWNALLDALEAPDAAELEVHALADGRADIRSSFDLADAIDTHRRVLETLRGGDAGMPVRAVVQEYDPPREGPPAGLRGAWPWRIAFADGNDAQPGWIWVTASVYELTAFDELLRAAASERLAVVFFDTDAGWTYSPAGLDATLRSTDHGKVERVAVELAATHDI